MQVKTSVKDQVRDHVLVWLLNNPQHAIRIDRARKKVREWLR